MAIELSPEQLDIVDYLYQQIDNPEGNNVVVSGSGGTGKTTMVCRMICQLLAEGKRVAVTAMTGKATAVLRGKIYETIRELDIQFEKENLLVQTISKITKESTVIGLAADGVTQYSNTWRDPIAFARNYDVLFVDELSMVPHYIAQWWQRGGIRVFGFGDECQLPEVVTEDSRKEIASLYHDLNLPSRNKLISGFGVKSLKTKAQKQLHTVLRSSSEIAFLCGELRDFTQTSAQIIQRIKDWGAKSDSIQYSTSMKDLETDRDWQILCFTNKMCRRINEKLKLSKIDYPLPDDKILLFDNLSRLGLYNGDVILFKELLGRLTKKNKGKNRKIYVCMKWQGQMPRLNGVTRQEQLFAQNYVDYRVMAELVHKRRMRDLPQTLKDSGYPQEQVDGWLKEIEELQEQYPNDPATCFLEILKGFEEQDRDMYLKIVAAAEPLPELYVVSCDYGYAVTTHKSQGSEYDKVCYVLEQFNRALLYTGLSRAKKQLKVINLTGED